MKRFGAWLLFDEEWELFIGTVGRLIAEPQPTRSEARVYIVKQQGRNVIRDAESRVEQVGASDRIVIVKQNRRDFVEPL